RSASAARTTPARSARSSCRTRRWSATAPPGRGSSPRRSATASLWPSATDGAIGEASMLRVLQSVLGLGLLVGLVLLLYGCMKLARAQEPNGEQIEFGLPGVEVEEVPEVSPAAERVQSLAVALIGLGGLIILPAGGLLLATFLWRGKTPPPGAAQ